MPAEYEPTAEQRALVESASAIGITQAEIANQLKEDAAQAFSGGAEQRQIQSLPSRRACTKATYAARNRCWRPGSHIPPSPPGRESLPAARAVALPARSCGLPGYLAQAVAIEGRT